MQLQADANHNPLSYIQIYHFTYTNIIKMDNEQFGAFEDAPPQLSQQVAHNSNNIQEDSFLSLSVQNENSHHIDNSNAHGFYSLESNPTESKPADIDDIVKVQSFWPHLTKNASAHLAIDPSMLVNLHKNHSQTEQNNPPIQQQDLSSYQGEPDETKNSLSVSSGGVYSMNNQEYSKKQNKINFQENNKNSPIIPPIFNNFQQNNSPKKDQSLNIILHNSQSISKDETFQLYSNPINLKQEQMKQYVSINMNTDYNLKMNQNYSQLTSQSNPIQQQDIKIKPNQQIINPNNDQLIIEQQQFQFTNSNHQNQIQVQAIKSDLTKIINNESNIIKDDYWKPSVNIYNSPITNEIPQIVSQNSKLSEFENQQKSAQVQVVQNLQHQKKEESQQLEYQKPTHLTQQMNLQLQNQVQEQDQFGDFEQVHNEMQSNAQYLQTNKTVQEYNIVQISSDHADSTEQQYKKSCLKQLQSLVDSLPNYSFLFLQTFQS